MRVRILGAGIIGLSCADELARRGHQVELVDPDPACGASYAAAGMLSPCAEVWHGEEALLDLGRRSLAMWPEYAARLAIPLHTAGTLLAGRDHGDLQQVERQCRLLRGRGIEVTVLDKRELRRHEPLLGPRVAGGALLRDDHSVDPRDVLTALLTRTRVVAEPGPPCDVTVVATGARLPEPFGHLVRGVRGEIIRARGDVLLGHTVRGWVHGEPVYVVPRASGEVVIGATTEEHNAAPVATIGGVARLLRAARELVPSLDDAQFTEAIARDRPGTPDNLPLVGPSGEDGVVLAAGHFRNGVLLAPLTAHLVAEHLDTGYVEPALDPRRLAREGTHR